MILIFLILAAALYTAKNVIQDEHVTRDGQWKIDASERVKIIYKVCYIGSIIFFITPIIIIIFSLTCK